MTKRNIGLDELPRERAFRTPQDLGDGYRPDPQASRRCSETRIMQRDLLPRELCRGGMSALIGARHSGDPEHRCAAVRGRR